MQNNPENQSISTQSTDNVVRQEQRQELQQAQREAQKTSSISPFVMMVGGIIILGIGAALGATFLQISAPKTVVPQNGTFQETADEAAVTPISSTFKALNESTFASYPIVKSDTLYFIPINPEIGVFSPSLAVKWGEAASGFGSSDPLASPDNQKVALIEKETGNLLLVTADGKQQVRVSNQIQVRYLSGWSADSMRLVVYADSPTIESLFMPEGPVPESAIPPIQQLPTQVFATGYYLVDLEKQEISFLPYFEGSSFITWLDDHRVLLNLEEGVQKHYVVFDFANQEANSEFLKGALDQYFGEQISFSRDGAMWALTLSPTNLVNTNNSVAQIVLAPFPSVTGEVIGDGKFAQVQMPIVSPNGDRVIFQGYDVVNGPNFVYYYDGVETVRLFEGLPRKWVTNDKFIYTITNEIGATNPSLTNHVYLYDINTKENIKLFSI